MPSSLEKFLASELDGSYIIGHASVLVRLAGKLILFDPCWGDYAPYGDNWHFWPKQIDATKLLRRVDAILISHLHADHLCPEIIAASTCDVHILAGRPNIRAQLVKHGASRVVEYAAEMWLPLTGDVRVYWVRHPTNEVDSLPFLRANGVTISLGSDCYLDRATLERIRPEVPNLTVAHVPYQFIYWWPFLQRNLPPEKKRKEIARCVTQAASRATDFCTVLQPKLAIGTGGDLYYAGGKRHILNRHLLVNSPPPPIQRMIAGDYVLLKNGLPHYRFQGALDGDSFPQDRLGPLDLNTALITPTVKHLERIENRLRGRIPDVPVDELIINEIVIDLRLVKASYRLGGPRRNFCRFDVDAAIYTQWLRGELTFQEVLGTRRFEFSREPDVWFPELFALCHDVL